MTLSAGTRLGSYQILAPLGVGGMGEVYRARDGKLHREVAIKVLPERLSADQEALARFESEARAIAALSHPNILSIFDFGQEKGISYAATELLEGETLRVKLVGGPLPARRVFDYAVQIARGLAAAHAKGIVHRDLKPENVFVTAGGHVKILDFGLAKRDIPYHTGEDLPTASRLTEPGAVMGTVGYMSPEQARGRSADARSDIFSFGAILYEMLSGERPFRGDTPAETLTSILRDDPPEIRRGLADVPPALERIARRCLEKDPEARFQLARDLEYLLEDVRGAPSRTAEAPSPRAESTAKGKRSVAVLLFKDLARDPGNAHLGVGLADATITELSHVKSLLVRPTASILRYQDRSVDPEEAGRELGVDAVVDGNFQRAGSRMRVTVQLIASSDGRSLWGTKIDTSLDDIFQMQDEVSRQIAEALKVELSPSDERRLARATRPTGMAYEMYLRGRFHLFRETLPDINAAIEAFEAARNVDPDFALAWAGLSAAYTRLGFSFEPEGDWNARAEAACEKALAIDPGLPEGRYLRGLLVWTPQRGFDHAAAIRELAAAIAGQPSLAEAHERLAVVLFHIGLLEESVREFEQALAIHPEYTMAEMHLASCLFLQGRYREALEMQTAVGERSLSPWGNYQVALYQLRLGQIEAAVATADRGARQFPNEVLVYSLRALIAACRGEAAEADRQIELTEGNRKAFGHYHHAQYDVACAYAVLGRKEEALSWLAVAAHNGFPCHPFFERDPMLESIRGEERFSSLLRELATECDGYRRLYRDLVLSRFGESQAVP